MPTLKKATQSKSRNLNRAERVKIYNSTKWRELRLAYLMEHPLCEQCLEEGVITAAEDIHHLDSPFNYSGNYRIYKAYDYTNLKSLCKKCHGELHKKEGRTNG